MEDIGENLNIIFDYMEEKEEIRTHIFFRVTIPLKEGRVEQSTTQFC